MGEAKQRRIAKAAGCPWERDQLPSPPPKPWYMDPMSPRSQELRERAILAPPPERTLESIKRHIVKSTMEKRVVVDDPRGLLVRRRRTVGMDLAMVLAALGTEPIITRGQK